MATPGPIQRVGHLVTGTVTLPITLLRYAAADPLISGSLLLALTRAPDVYRGRLLKLLDDIGLSDNHTAALVKSLKFLLVFGIGRRLNQALNKFALNNWHFRKPGVPFKFGDAKKSELVVVTGGCSGFGYYMVKGFSKYARVIILDVSPLPADLKIPGVYYYQIDLTDFAAIASTAELIRKEHGNPTVLVNNAGIAIGATILDSSPKLIDRIFKVNLSSYFVLIREFLPAMLKARKGHIVTIASISSFFSAPGLVDYSSTKVGALFLHEGLRAELRTRYENGHCIQTTCVHPLWHATGMVKPHQNKLAKSGVPVDPPSNVSDAVVEQVLAARSGQIFMPRNTERMLVPRNFPIWIQDILLYVESKTTNLAFDPSASKDAIGQNQLIE